MKRGVRGLLVLLVTAVIAWYLYRHGQDFLLLRHFDARYLPPMLAVAVVAIVTNGQILRLLVQRLGIRLNVSEWFGLTVLHGFGNYLPIPQAGAVARGLYLKKVHGLDYSSFTATVLVTYVGFVACDGLVGLLTVGWLHFVEGHAPLPLYVLFLALTGAFCLLAASRLRFPMSPRLRTFVDALRVLGQGHVMLRVSAFQILLIGLGAVGLWLAFVSLGRPISLPASLLLTLVSMASGVVNVTPGNLGVAEATAWITARWIGVDGNEAVVAFTLFRLSSILVVFTLAPFFVSRLSATAAPGIKSANG